MEKRETRLVRALWIFRVLYYGGLLCIWQLCCCKEYRWCTR